MPGQVGVNVGGAYVVRPGVFTTIDTKAMVPLSSGPGGIVAVLGLTDGGAPNQVYTFGSYSDARAVLRRGQALSYLKRIFAPSGDVPGASVVKFVRVGSPAQASVVGAGITFTSRDYGRHTNGINVQIVAGTGSSWVCTVTKPADGYSASYTVGPAIMVSYTGAGTSPKLLFNHATGEATLQLTGATAATFQYPDASVTLSNLIAWINGQAGWTATLVGDGSMPVQYMDNPASGSTPAISATPTAHPANQGALVWMLQRDKVVSGALVTPGTMTVLSAVAVTPLAGGSGTGFDTVTATDFDAPLALLESTEVHHLFLCSNLSTVQDKAYAHVLQMRATQRKRLRIFYTGGAVGETVAQACTAAQRLAGPVVYGWNGTTDSNPETGASENLGGLGLAAQLCGMAAGTPASTPLTNKGVVCSVLENPNVKDADLETLLVGGVTPAAFSPVTGAATVIQAITTYQGGANVSFRKLQGLRIQDDLARGFQAILNDFVGEPLNVITARRIKARVAAYLDGVTVNSANPEGIITQGQVGTTVTPAWEALSVSSDGLQTWNIAVNVHPVGESDFIVVNLSLTPATIEV